MTKPSSFLQLLRMHWDHILGCEHLMDSFLAKKHVVSFGFMTWCALQKANPHVSGIYSQMTFRRLMVVKMTRFLWTIEFTDHKKIAWMRIHHRNNLSGKLIHTDCSPRISHSTTVQLFLSSEAKGGTTGCNLRKWYTRFMLLRPMVAHSCCECCCRWERIQRSGEFTAIL